MQVQLTQEAKIISDFYSIRAIFAFVGFVNGLRVVQLVPPSFSSSAASGGHEDMLDRMAPGYY